MSHPKSKKCGPHVELASNEAARVTRCGCGVVHVHLHAQGMSLRVDATHLRHVANALGAASRLVDIADTAGSAPTESMN